MTDLEYLLHYGPESPLKLFSGIRFLFYKQGLVGLEARREPTFCFTAEQKGNQTSPHPKIALAAKASIQAEPSLIGSAATDLASNI